VNASAVPHLYQEELYQFRSPLVVVLARAWESYSTDEQQLLKKILTSIKVDMNAVQLITAPALDLNSLHTYGAGKVLVFGSEISESLGKYQQTSAQGFTVIHADDLSALDDQKKKNLWIALRPMFGV
jgi:hypothetical protein